MLSVLNNMMLNIVLVLKRIRRSSLYHGMDMARNQSEKHIVHTHFPGELILF